jgi:hypothetical protein
MCADRAVFAVQDLRPEVLCHVAPAVKLIKMRRAPVKAGPVCGANHSALLLSLDRFDAAERCSMAFGVLQAAAEEVLLTTDIASEQ